MTDKLPPKSAQDIFIEKQIEEFQKTWESKTTEQRIDILLEMALKTMVRQDMLETVVSGIPYVQEQIAKKIEEKKTQSTKKEFKNA